jgi:hypothetical protein
MAELGLGWIDRQVHLVRDRRGQRIGRQDARRERDDGRGENPVHETSARKAPARRLPPHPSHLS